MKYEMAKSRFLGLGDCGSGGDIYKFFIKNYMINWDCSFLNRLGYNEESLWKCLLQRKKHWFTYYNPDPCAVMFRMSEVEDTREWCLISSFSLQHLRAESFFRDKQPNLIYSPCSNAVASMHWNPERSCGLGTSSPKGTFVPSPKVSPCRSNGSTLQYIACARLCWSWRQISSEDLAGCVIPRLHNWGSACQLCSSKALLHASLSSEVNLWGTTSDRAFSSAILGLLFFLLRLFLLLPVISFLWSSQGF